MSNGFDETFSRFSELTIDDVKNFANAMDIALGCPACQQQQMVVFQAVDTESGKLQENKPALGSLSIHVDSANKKTVNSVVITWCCTRCGNFDQTMAANVLEWKKNKEAKDGE